ncbi:MAG: C25 family cysteine peptidase [Planctomycetota bacterium]
MKNIAALLFLAHLAAAQDMLVVAPEEFHGSVAIWKKYKEETGLRIVVETPAKKIAAQVQAAFQKSGGKLRFVMLVGDTDRIPCDYVMANAIRPHERDPRIATDAKIADLDGDGLPDLAVGRIPADGVQRAAQLLARSIRYERSTDTTEWRRRVNLVAGVGGFGVLQDFAIETVTRILLKDHIPAEYDVSLTYGNPRSPHCPYPPEFAQAFIDRFQEPALFCAYIGHGSANGLDTVRYGGKRYPIFNSSVTPWMKFGTPPPIAVFLACTTGKFDGRKGCLAEKLLRTKNGPVAVLASSRVSMPYANGIFAKEFLDAAFEGRAATLGEVVTLAKRRLVNADPKDKRRAALESLAATFYKPLDPMARVTERAEHVWLYNLFGDPSLKLPLPVPASVSCASTVAAGAKLTVRGSAPFSGRVRIELTRLRETPAAKRPAGDESADAFRKTYAASNRRVIVETTESADGGFEVELTVPDTVSPGRYRVRVFVSGKTGSAAGATTVTVN